MLTFDSGGDRSIDLLLDYLTQFNPEKIDLLLEQNLRNQRQSQNYILPIALTSIGRKDQKLKWTLYKNGCDFP